MATTGQELCLDKMPNKRVKNKDELRQEQKFAIPEKNLKIEKATTEQDSALPQADDVVMNDTADGPPVYKVTKTTDFL